MGCSEPSRGGMWAGMRGEISDLRGIGWILGTCGGPSRGGMWAGLGRGVSDLWALGWVFGPWRGSILALRGGFCERCCGQRVRNLKFENGS